MILSFPWVTGFPPIPVIRFARYNFYSTSGNSTNPVTTASLPPFPGVTHRFWEVTTTKRVQTPQTKVKITSMELSTRYA